jgi:hypothetical protein
MPSVVPATTLKRRLVLRRQRDRGDLRLVAHLGQEEGQQRRAEHAHARERASFSSNLSGISVHPRHGEERQTQDPAQGLRPDQRRDPGADGTRERVIGQCCDQDAEDDRNGAAEPRREHEGQQLRLVADFGQRDDAR